jgi:ATP adenylyltransferase
MSEQCSICDELLSKAGKGFPRAYRELVESGLTKLHTGKRLSVLPSLGALNASHILIVSNDHLESFAQFSEEVSAEFAGLQAAVRGLNLEKGTSDIIFFEHGAGCVIDTSGACIAHAHVHAVSHAPGLFETLRGNANFVKIPDGVCFGKLADTQHGYVLYEDVFGTRWIANAPGFPPQYFRYVYAACEGKPLVWNWRSDPRVQVVREVIKRYSSLKHIK